MSSILYAPRIPTSGTIPQGAGGIASTPGIPALDEDAGYFSYVRHDDKGHPVSVLRHASGANFNMGMDGASPLVAGVCTPEQESRLVGYLMSEKHIWTRYGMTAVDQSAPYYRDDGYWNGTVWMPHQWFFWKTLLDLGRADEAHQVAKTALDQTANTITQTVAGTRRTW